MKKLLIIGGTRFLGLEFLKLVNQYEIYIASRRKIKAKNFIIIDRKSQQDLDNLFVDIEYDVVIDFICYSAMDASILWNSIQIQKKIPKLIIISTVFTYGNPLEIESPIFCNEESFMANYELNSFKDRPETSYIQGKRDMECFFNKKIQNEKLVILRFPIILGAEDYTSRTHFYYNLIKKKLVVNPKKISNKSSYIFSKEAANSIFDFVKNDEYGTYNIAFKPISEKNLIELYCLYFNIKIDSIIKKDIKLSDTPFTTNFDFNILSEKYTSKHPFGISFKDALFRELAKIET